MHGDVLQPMVMIHKVDGSSIALQNVEDSVVDRHHNAAQNHGSPVSVVKKERQQGKN